METFSTLLEIGEGIHRSPVGYPPVSPTRDQKYIPHSYPSLENTPFSRILDEKNTPFSTEIADFDVQ